jgi:DNA repair exonuclease SbcCD ATPase subunit
MENTEVIKIQEINPLIKDFEGFRERQLRVLNENPFIAINDNSDYELARRARTNLVTARTDIEKQDKFIASVLTKFRKNILEIKENLLSITKKAEETQQQEVKRWEEKKEAIRLEKIRLDDERKQKIKDEISAFFNRWNGILQTLQYNEIENFQKLYKDSSNAEDLGKFEEFEIDFLERRAAFENQMLQNIDYLNIKEAERLENERIKAAQQAREDELNKQQKTLEEEKKRQEAELKRKADELEKQKAEIEAQKKALKDSMSEPAETPQRHECSEIVEYGECSGIAEYGECTQEQPIIDMINYFEEYINRACEITYKMINGKLYPDKGQIGYWKEKLHVLNLNINQLSDNAK